MEKIKENKMGYMPIPGLILSMSLPMMVSMLVLATYNIVDSMYVSQISENALTAVSLVFPLQMLITAVSVGTGIGANSLVARRLGGKRQQDADAAASNGIFLAIAGGLVFFMLFGLFSPALVRMFRPEAEIYTMAVTYLTIVGTPCIFVNVQVMIEKLLQGTGCAVHSMIIQLSGAIFNIVFDPILIFGRYGFPKLGVAGAALATIGGQFFGMLLGLCFLSRKGCMVHIRVKGFRPSLQSIKDIYQVGLPNIFLQMVGSIMTGGLNRLLMSLTPVAVSVLGVYFKLQSFVFMPVFGLNSGTMPVMAYNYGARRPRRIMNALKCGSLFALVIMLAGTAIFHLRTPWMLSLFNAKPGSALMELGVPALRIISIGFPIAALCIMGSSLFQAVGNGKLSFFISALRQLVLLLPIAYIFSGIFGLTAVWYAFLVSETITIVVVFMLVYRVYKCHIKPMDRVKGCSQKGTPEK